jgi:hypothetical protein
MPEDKGSDSITDQEIAFAHLVLSNTMTDHQAAQAVGLSPGSAASTKAKPRVHAYMLGHRSATQQPRIQQGAKEHHPPILDRKQVLDRLWEIAHLSPEITRGSVTGQVKALSIIVAMENFIPNRHAATVAKTPAPGPAPEIYKAAWLRPQKTTTDDHQPNPVPARKEDALAPGSTAEAASEPSPSPSTFVTPSNPPETPSAAPNLPEFVFVPDLRVPFSIKKDPFAPRRR